MLPLRQEYNGFRKSIIKDLDFLAPRLRFEDKREILSNSGMIPFQALYLSYKYSDISFTIVNPKDEPVGIFGVNNAGNNVGAIWLLATNDLSTAQILEKKIWEVWLIHPSDDRRGFRLTELLTQGSRLMNMGELSKAYELFTKIIATEPDWSEVWNRRATVLYLMNQYQASLDDIKITLTLEPRHFGALSGQALNYIELKQYEKAIKSYEKAQEIYPAMRSPKIMIKQIEELIKQQTI